MPRVISITGTLVAMLVAAPGAVGQVTSSQDTAKSPWPAATRGPTFGDGVSADSSFIRQAIRGNYTEVALGRLAGSRASNSEVKDFAERMVEDHNSLNKEWIDLAQDNDMKVAVEFGESGQQAVDRLEKLSGTAFDQAYMAEMIREHEQDLAGFQQMANAARSSEVRQLASSGASTIRVHLASAQQVGSRVGVSSTAGRAGGVPTPVPAPSSDDRTRRTTTDDRTNAENPDNRTNNERAALGGADRTFVDNVLSDHLMHIRLAKRAERESERDAIRGLAGRIDKDFTSWSERWERFADRREAEVNSHLTRHNREKLERLEKASDRNEFDRAYADIVADHLESMVQDYRDTRQKTQTTEIRRMIDDELPVIRDLLSHAQRLHSQVDSDGTLRAKDRAFIQNVLQDHLMHVRLAELAQREARGERIRQLAELMEEEFDEWQERWEALAEQYDVPVTGHLDPLHEQKVDRLKQVSRGDVDRTYTAIVTEHLESVVPYFEKEGKAVRPAAVGRLVDEELPVLRQILRGFRGL
jgi:putative membrane protein